MYWIILVIFFAHWFFSLFFHTAFLHRFGSHKMFTMSPFMEKVFYFFTWFFQGSSYLVPRAYAVMHRMHHEYSDTKKDPHSPIFYRDVFQMMWETKKIYNDFKTGAITPESKFSNDLPVWDKMDRFGDHMLVRTIWGAIYFATYALVITHYDLSWWWCALLPIHFLMGPIQGAFVNWCGHKYGYQNFDNKDHSHNSTPFGLFLMGELFQNNHHMYPLSPNFAKKWFEIDFTYPILKFLAFIKVIRFVEVKQ